MVITSYIARTIWFGSLSLIKISSNQIKTIERNEVWCYKPRSRGSPYSKIHILMSLYFLAHIVLGFHTYVIPYIKSSLLSNKDTRCFPEPCAVRNF